MLLTAGGTMATRRTKATQTKLGLAAQNKIVSIWEGTFKGAFFERSWQLDEKAD